MGDANEFVSPISSGFDDLCLIYCLGFQIKRRNVPSATLNCLGVQIQNKFANFEPERLLFRIGQI